MLVQLVHCGHDKVLICTERGKVGHVYDTRGMLLRLYGAPVESKDVPFECILQNCSFKGLVLTDVRTVAKEDYDAVMNKIELAVNN